VLVAPILQLYHQEMAMEVAAEVVDLLRSMKSSSKSLKETSANT